MKKDIKTYVLAVLFLSAGCCILMYSPKYIPLDSPISLVAIFAGVFSFFKGICHTIHCK